jgi:hypothetical protein
MRNGSLFWGFLLIAVGGLFALQAMNIIENVTNFLWPLFLIALGAWILWGAFARPSLEPGSAGSFSIDLQGASRVAFDLDHGAGQVLVAGGAPAGIAVSGVQATGINVASELEQESLHVKVEAGPSFLPFLGPDGGAWQFQLTNEVPLSLDVDAGAASLRFDLSQVKLSSFKLDTGASSVSLILPAEGQPLVEIESGAASVDITVPQSMAARIRSEAGASSLSVEPRLEYRGDGLYQSANFETAVNRVEIRLEGGANSVSIHS